MPTNISEVVRQLLEGMHTMSKSETLIGEPIQSRNGTVIPVHRLRVRFAAGAAEGHANGAPRRGDAGVRGAGGTVQIDPVAVIAVGSDGAPRVLVVDGEATGALGRLMEELPEIALKAARTLGNRLSGHHQDERTSQKDEESDERKSP
jgi:uncharacterized spore protein YtfJ